MTTGSPVLAGGAQFFCAPESARLTTSRKSDSTEVRISNQDPDIEIPVLNAMPLIFK